MRTFEQFTYDVFPTSGAASSYIRAIKIIDELFSHDDIYGLNGTSLSLVDDLEILLEIEHFVIEQESRYCKELPSFFDNVGPKQTSYPRKGFCKAAMAHLIKYREYVLHQIADEEIFSKARTGSKLSKDLLKFFDLEKKGEDRETDTKVRIGQDYFRKMILTNYHEKCCVTGLDVPKLLRASHIVEWSKNKANRLNPENGLCLSATYDAAFDQHLISFDDDYRMIVSKQIRDHYTTEITKEYFSKFEGKKIILPTMYMPSKDLLATHRDQLVG